MIGQNKVRQEFPADREGKKEESERCHVATKRNRCQGTLLVNHSLEVKYKIIEMGEFKM